MTRREFSNLLQENELPSDYYILISSMLYSYGAKEFTSCVSNWVNSNCGAADNVAYLNQILNSLANEYCNGNSTKPSVLTSEIVTTYSQCLKLQKLNYLLNP